MRRIIFNTLCTMIFIAVMYGFRSYLNWIDEAFRNGLVCGMLGMALFFYFIEWLEPGILSAHSHRKESAKRFREAQLANEEGDSPPRLPH